MTKPYPHSTSDRSDVMRESWRRRRAANETGYQIDKGIPIPKESTPRILYPFARLEVGDSIVGDMRMRAAAYVHVARHPGWEFTWRKLDKGEGVGTGQIRIWRTA